MKRLAVTLAALWLAALLTALALRLATRAAQLRAIREA
jgi:hypothetical protein